MEALSVDKIPAGAEWQYEPKWDGFRCIAFCNGKKIDLHSKSGQALGRYFPEVVTGLGELDAGNFVLDGEIVIPGNDGFSFDALLQRIHPAASRVARLSKETPAIFVVFDLLAFGNDSLLGKPLRERRKLLEKFSSKYFDKQNTVRLSPFTNEVSRAHKWLAKAGFVLDGIIAKRIDLPYMSGTRDGMQKIKNYRSADCVIGGFRYATGRRVVGSLLLGLYDRDGLLNHVGFTSGIAEAERKSLTAKLEPLIAPPGFTGSAPGGPSRWNTGKAAEWQPLKPVLVVEVSYDHISGDRFRHGTRILRWRPDKKPKQCTMDQMKQQGTKTAELLTIPRKTLRKSSR